MCAAGVFRGSADICMTCIVGQANLQATTESGVLTSCKKISGTCGGCTDDQVLNFYNCGANGNLGMAPPVVGTPTVDTPVIGTPVPPTEDSGTTPFTPVPPVPATDITTPNTDVAAEINSATEPKDYIDGPAPDSSCPLEAGVPIKSGDPCDTQGYQYLQCYYPGKKVCSCWAVQRQFSCIIND